MDFDLDFTNDEIEAGVARTYLTEGWHRFVVTGHKKGQTKSARKSWYVTLTCAPLSNPDDGDSRLDSVSVRDMIVLPKANPDAEDTSQPRTLGLCEARLRAYLGPNEIPYPPRRGNNGSYEFDGSEITRDETGSARMEVGTKVGGALKKLWSDPDSFLNYAFFGLVAHDGDYGPKISRWTHELPDGIELVPSDGMVVEETFAKEETSEAVVESKPAKKAKKRRK